MGQVYIFTNSDHPDLVKIGYSNSWKRLLSSIQNDSNNLARVECYAYYEVDKPFADKIFHGIVETLNPSLLFTTDDEGKEGWFKLDKDEAYKLFKAIAELSNTESQLHKIGEEVTESQEKAKMPRTITKASYTIRGTRTVKELADTDALISRPVSFTLFGKKHNLKTAAWRTMLHELILVLYSIDPTKIQELQNVRFSFLEKVTKRSETTRAYVTNDVETIANLEKLHRGHYVIPKTNICIYTHFNAPDILRFIKFLLRIYNIDYGECAIDFGPDENESKSKRPHPTFHNEVGRCFDRYSLINFVNSHGYDIPSHQTTYASKNARYDYYWANPQVRVIDDDWWIVLDDYLNRIIHIFKIPGKTIKPGTLQIRTDKPVFQLIILYLDEDFTDTPSGFKFVPYKIGEIYYSAEEVAENNEPKSVVEEKAEDSYTLTSEEEAEIADFLKNCF